MGHLPRLRSVCISREMAALRQPKDVSLSDQADFADLVLKALSGTSSVKRLSIDDSDSILVLQRYIPGSARCVVPVDKTTSAQTTDVL